MWVLLAVLLSGVACVGERLAGGIEVQAEEAFVTKKHHGLQEGSTVTELTLTLTSWGRNCDSNPNAFIVQLCSWEPEGSNCTHVQASPTYGTQRVYPGITLNSTTLEVRFTNLNSDYCGIDAQYTITMDEDEVHTTKEVAMTDSTPEDSLQVQCAKNGTYYGEWTTHVAHPYDYVYSVSMSLTSWGEGCDSSKTHWGLQLCTGTSDTTCSSYTVPQHNGWRKVFVGATFHFNEPSGSLRLRVYNRNTDMRYCGLDVRKIVLRSLHAAPVAASVINPYTLPPAIPQAPGSPPRSRGFVGLCVGGAVLFILLAAATYPTCRKWVLYCRMRYLNWRGARKILFDAAVCSETVSVTLPMQEMSSMNTPLLLSPQSFSPHSLCSPPSLESEIAE
eukprot:TRINITY_DN12798_c3_g1_i1.p1 TRINITY_DN12798_c3_g1~~TRINITY_DN12798_c3_g1_i1.p1  ORF type:complete len:403 (+),score=61.06 TRINITY_DN12798_c3_g1_i1:45-1211(+)